MNGMIAALSATWQVVRMTSIFAGAYEPSVELKLRGLLGLREPRMGTRCNKTWGLKERHRKAAMLSTFR